VSAWKEDVVRRLRTLNVAIKNVPVGAWGERLTHRLRALYLGTIRNRILVFAALATLIPALLTTWVSYGQQRRSLDDNMARALSAVSSEAAREMGVWIDARLYELRVAASSYVVSENLARVLEGRDARQALGRLRDHLGSVRERYRGYDALLVADTLARLVASSPLRTGLVPLPREVLSDLPAGAAHVGETFWDETSGMPAMVLSLPIRQADGRFAGVLAAKIDLRSIADILVRLTPGEGRDIYVMTETGRLVLTARSSSAELMRTQIPDSTARALFDGEGQTVAHTRADGQQVVGALRRVPRLGWAAVAEMTQAEARRPVGQLRMDTAWRILALLAGVGLMVSVVGLLIVRPLDRLTRAAAKVAAGDLSVELPAGGSGEVGYLTRGFNTLVSRLREREGQGELERLSVTDALTGLYNRRHLMGTLASEVQRSRRLRRTFALMLADVDHFKQYNDTHGHLEGDAALVKLAEILRKTTRGVDCVARYGGEEFLVLLLETTITTAALVAERIRAHVALETFGRGRITVSIGVAEFPAHGGTPEELIEAADAAMYQAKGEGRDRVVTAGARQERTKERRGPRKRRA
jgi:diguanylate cyclase (GGDEF)-like protein